MQCVTLDIGTAFHPEGDYLHDAFLPALFNGDTYQFPNRVVTVLSVNQGWVAPPQRTQTTGYNWTDSCVIIGHLVAALFGKA